MRFHVLNLKASLLFCWLKRPILRLLSTLDSFGASVTHFFEIDLHSSSDLSFETTVSFLLPISPAVGLSSLPHTFLSRSVDLQLWSSTRSSKEKQRTFIIAIWLQMERSDWSRNILEFGATRCTWCYQTPFSRTLKGAGRRDCSKHNLALCRAKLCCPILSVQPYMHVMWDTFYKLQSTLVCAQVDLLILLCVKSAVNVFIFKCANVTKEPDRVIVG